MVEEVGQVSVSEREAASVGEIEPAEGVLDVQAEGSGVAGHGVDVEVGVAEDEVCFERLRGVVGGGGEDRVDDGGVAQVAEVDEGLCAGVEEGLDGAGGDVGAAMGIC
jgi:hypothetical protein